MKPNLILPQLFARFEKFLIISHKKAQRTFQSQAGKKNYKTIKKNSNIRGLMLTRRKISYTFLYPRMTAG